MKNIAVTRTAGFEFMKTQPTIGPLFAESTGEGYSKAFKVWGSLGAAKVHVATFKVQADATLFCGAPELFETLTRIVEQWDVNADGQVGVGFVNDARAALAKANGGVK